ncbi:MAG: biopolymer transporter ExbD [Blastocatellia bacterium]
MGMAVGSGEGGLVSDINVTPMVDVMLVLLIIFMVIAPMLQSGVSVALPKSKNPESDPNIIKETSAVIAVPTDTEVYFGRDKVNKEDLASILKDKLKDKFKDQPPDRQVVYIKSGTMVKYETVVGVIDAVREAGYDKIGLVAEKEKGKPGGGT